MNHLNCIPSHKDDLFAAERAKQVGFPMLNPIIPDLLEWLKDANWPVSQPIASVLTQAGPEIVPHLKEILRGSDVIWKYWTIALLLRQVDQEILDDLRIDLERLANQPDTPDRNEEVDGIARELLRDRFGKRNPST